MEQTLADTPELRRLEAAMNVGDVYIVDEEGRPMSLAETLDRPCWAHVRAASDGEFYVQELRSGSRNLLRPYYQDIFHPFTTD